MEETNQDNRASVDRFVMQRFTGDDAYEDGERLNAAVIVALEDEAQKLRKKILKVEQLGFACSMLELAEARARLAWIDAVLSDPSA